MIHIARVVRSNPKPDDLAAFRSALVSGGDSRIALDPATGLNRYLCPPTPGAGLVCLGSCTASPISPVGFAASQQCFGDLTSATGREAVERHVRWEAEVRDAISSYFGIEGLAEVVLQASGTDAVAWTAAALAQRAGDQPITAIVTTPSETGTGVRLAAACRGFDSGPAFGKRLLADVRINTIEVALRTQDGLPRGDDELIAAFAAAAAAAAAHGPRAIYITHGSKTGLVAPLAVPTGADVVVDACQARITPRAVRGYLGKGWPVLVTGSKFFQGPAFSGAVLVPTGRLVTPTPWAQSIGVGPLLRWVAALAGIKNAAMLDDAPRDITRATQAVNVALHRIPGVEIMPGPSAAMCSAAGWPQSIITFKIGASSGPNRCLSVRELRAVYERLASDGVLLGQPVGLGRSAGLRVALGASDLGSDRLAWKLDRLLSALARVTGPAAPTARAAAGVA